MTIPFLLPWRLKFEGRVGVALLLCGSLWAGRALAADGDTFRVSAFSIVDRPHSLFGQKPAAEHGKAYTIAGIKRSEASAPLAQPIDESRVLGQLREELSARGFHETGTNSVPDITLTVRYGRGRAPDPYADDAEITGGYLGHYGAQNDRAISGGEKLFVVVSAWEFPGFNPKAKRKLLWRTVVGTDAVNRDLGEIAGKLFAAGGSYFDHETAQEEVTQASSPSKAE